MKRATKKLRVVGTGQLMIRWRCNAALEDCTEAIPNLAGTELNVLAALKRLYGIATTLVTSLPDHGLGRKALNAVRGLGVETDDLRMFPFRGVGEEHRLPIYFTDVTGTSIVDRFRGTGPFYEGQRPWKTIFRGATHFLTTGITAALEPGVNNKKILAAAAAAHAAGCEFIFDLGYRGTQWELHGGLDAFIDDCRPIIDECDIFTGNEEMIMGRLGTYDELFRRHSRLHTILATRRVEHSTVQHDVGVIAHLRDGRSAESAMYPLSLVDRIGGGDAAIAAALGLLMKRGSLKRAVDLSAAALAHVSRTPGDQLVATMGELEAVVTGQRTKR